MKRLIIIVSFVLFALLTACTRQVGWVGMNYGNTFNATYMHFDGKQKETIQISAGDTFSLDYDVEIEEGVLTLQMLNPDKDVLWEATFLQDNSDEFSFTSEESGRYTLNVLGDETQGGFDLEWNIAE